MSVSNSLRRRMPLAVASLCAAWFVAQVSPAAAQTQSPVEFTASVPAAPAQMQIYKLATTKAPLDFLNEKLSVLKLPTLKLEQKIYITRGETGQEDRDRVRAFVDATSGDAHFIPNLAELIRPATAVKAVPLERAQSVARAALTDVRFIPKDVTELRFADPITVMGGATAHAPADAKIAAAVTRTEPRVVLTMVPAIRYASGFRVYGLGSHALVSLANDGSIVGALRRWRTASLGERIETHITAEQVRSEIERQLRPQVAAKGTRATVDKISVAYYDGNANYLQPVYYFEATITPADKKISITRTAGYVPIGKALERIPDLAAEPTGPTPTKPKEALEASPRAEMQSQPATGGAAVPDDISLGEYANQDWPNNGAYVDMSNTFLNGLTFLNSIFPGSTPPVVRTQWYVAYPWEVVGPLSKDYLNAVNVAYTVPHGDWLINTTLSNYGDTWYVPDIGTGGNPGFGAAAGGVLATWVIMSCEVIPSMYDRQNEAGGSGNPDTAFDAWWPVFQGLHNVIGFRTVMFYPDDNLQFGFGYDVSLGGDINAAWFQEVAANDGDDGTYNSQHLKGSPIVHYDRASTMIDARDLGQSIYSVGAQSASTTLWNFWMNN
jgi:Family of unknown function (DUF6345)